MELYIQRHEERRTKADRILLVDPAEKNSKPRRVLMIGKAEENTAGMENHVQGCRYTEIARSSEC
jgi:hypothetical protein